MVHFLGWAPLSVTGGGSKTSRFFGAVILLLRYHELHLCLQGVICDFNLELVRIILVLLQPLLQGGQEILVFILRCLVRLLADVLVVGQGFLIFLVFP